MYPEAFHHRIQVSKNIYSIFKALHPKMYHKLPLPLCDHQHFQQPPHFGHILDRIRNNLHLLEFEKCKTLLQVNPESDSKRKECLNNIKNLKEVMKKFSLY